MRETARIQQLECRIFESCALVRAVLNQLKKKMILDEGFIVFRTVSTGPNCAKIRGRSAIIVRDVVYTAVLGIISQWSRVVSHATPLMDGSWSMSSVSAHN